MDVLAMVCYIVWFLVLLLDALLRADVEDLLL